jgi:hypothetical protein
MDERAFSKSKYINTNDIIFPNLIVKIVNSAPISILNWTITNLTYRCMIMTLSFSRLNGRCHYRKQQMSSGHIHYYYELVDHIHLYDTTKIILPICITNHESNMTHSIQIFITLRKTKLVLQIPLYAPEKNWICFSKIVEYLPSWSKQNTSTNTMLLCHAVPKPAQGHAHKAGAPLSEPPQVSAVHRATSNRHAQETLVRWRTRLTRSVSGACDWRGMGGCHHGAW